MRNRKIAITIASFVAFVFLLVVISSIFSVRRVYAYSVNMALAYDSRVAEYNELIPNLQIVKKHNSILFFNKTKLKQELESAFSDIRIESIEKEIPSVVRINYALVFKALEVRVLTDSGYKFYQISEDGGIVSIEDSYNSYNQLPPIRIIGANIDLGGLDVDSNASSFASVGVATQILQGLHTIIGSTFGVLSTIESINIKDMSNGKIYINTKSTSTFIISNYNNNLFSKLQKLMYKFNEGDLTKIGILEINDDDYEANHRDRYDANELYNDGDWIE